MVAPPQDGTRKMNDGNVQHRFWRVLMSWGAAGDNGSAKRVTNAHLVGLRSRNWCGQNVLGILRRHWESTRGHSVTSLAQTGSFVWCCRCGARSAKFAKKLGEPCVGHPRSEEYARSIRLLSSGWHPKENRFLDHRSCLRCKHGPGGDNATKETTAIGLGLAELSQAVIRLRVAEAQPTNPMTRNTCS